MPHPGSDKRLSSSLRQQNSPTVLAAFPSVPPELRAILGRWDWALHEAGSTAEVARILRQRRVPVIICDRSLADGDWRDILHSIASLPSAPRLIVTAADADDVLWADVLNRGGYDVLAQPFREQEVIRVVASAFRQWVADDGRGPATPVD